MEFEPYVVRPEIFEYLLDHPEFASHVTRALKVARYKIWRDAGSLWLDDGWGVKGAFTLAHAEPGLRLMHAQGAYQSALPDIKGRAVVALAYKFQPAPQGRQQVATALTSFVQIDSAVLRAEESGPRGPPAPARVLQGEPGDRGQPRRRLRAGARAAGRVEAGAGGVPEAAGRAVTGAPLNG